MSEDSLNHIVDSLLQVYSVSEYQKQSAEQPSGGMVFLVLSAIILLILASIYSFYRNREKERTWDKGIIPDSFQATDENIFELFIAAGACMVALDRPNNLKAYGYINRYLYNRFPDQHYDISDSFSYSLKHRLKIGSLAKWSNSNLSFSRKKQLINYLAGIAYYSQGFISDIEKQYILSLLSKLNLPYESLDDHYRKNMEEEPVIRTSYSALSRHYQLLGVSESITIEELKIVYRQLVKKTHPDRFMNESEEVKLLKKEEFQRIQESYESIMKEKQ